MTNARRTISHADDWTRFLAWVADMPMPFTVAVMKGKGRSLDQNALLHKWFGEIARTREGHTLLDVKGECHKKYGVPIKMSDPQFAWVWSQTGAKLPYEKQCAYLASGVLNVSSTMTKAQLSQYMDEMSRDFTSQGVTLTQPEDRG